MVRLSSFFFAALLLCCFTVQSQSVPELTGRVVDNADILSSETEFAISYLLETHEDSTSNQLAVLTIPSLEGNTIEAYANRVFRTWGLGRSDVNNGVLLLIARDDRELRIEVGYGLEGALTDVEAGRIIDNVIVPKFRSNDFNGGVLTGVSAIIGTIEGTYEPPAGGVGGDEEFPWWVILIFAVTHGLVPMISTIRGLVNPPVSRYTAFVISLIFMGVVLFIFGFIALGETGFVVALTLIILYVVCYFAVDIYMSRSLKWKEIRKEVKEVYGTGNVTDIDAGWISFSAGGKSSSSGGGGGFSGGGGSSGGGGASGSW